MIYMPATVPEPLRPELRKVLSDPRSFIKLLKISDKQTQRLVFFEPNGEQLQLIEALEQHRKILVLKPRQIGISTLLRAYAFWRAYITPHRERWAVLSFAERSAKHLRRMDSLFHGELPELMRRELATDNTTDMEFADTGAALCSYTAGSKGGTRSFSLSSAHLSEFAYYPEPERVLAAVMATLPSDGQIIIESTPAGAGDIFHSLCSGAPGNGWTLVTFWWWQHAAYRARVAGLFRATAEEEQLRSRYGLSDDQLQWRRDQIATIGAHEFRREYPGCLEDAFSAGSSVYFDGDALDKIEPVAFRGEELSMFPPSKDEGYVAGVDVAAGVRKDYSVLVIASAVDYQPVYIFRSNRLSPADFSDIVWRQLTRYNNAYALVESNNHGHLIIDRLKGYGYRNLWTDSIGRDWTTTTQSKTAIFELLRVYIHTGMIVRLPDVALLELRSLVCEKIAPEAPKGLHDDCAVALALCYRALKDIPPAQVRQQRKHRMESFISNQRSRRSRAQPSPWKTNS